MEHYIGGTIWVGGNDGTAIGKPKLLSEWGNNARSMMEEEYKVSVTWQTRKIDREPKSNILEETALTS